MGRAQAKTIQRWQPEITLLHCRPSAPISLRQQVPSPKPPTPRPQIQALSHTESFTPSLQSLPWFEKGIVKSCSYNTWKTCIIMSLVFPKPQVVKIKIVLLSGIVRVKIIPYLTKVNVITFPQICTAFHSLQRAPPLLSHRNHTLIL